MFDATSTSWFLWWWLININQEQAPPLPKLKVRHNDGRDLINVDSFIRFELVQSLIDELDNRNGSQFRCMIGLHITHYFFSRLIATVLYSTSDYSTTVSPEVLQHADVTTGTHLDLRIYPLAQTSDDGGLPAVTQRQNQMQRQTDLSDTTCSVTRVCTLSVPNDI